MEDGVEKRLICVSRSSERNRCITVHKCTHLFLFTSHPLSPSKRAQCQDTFESPVTHVAQSIPFPVLV